MGAAERRRSFYVHSVQNNAKYFFNNIFDFLIHSDNVKVKQCFVCRLRFSIEVRNVVVIDKEILKLLSKVNFKLLKIFYLVSSQRKWDNCR